MSDTELFVVADRIFDGDEVRAGLAVALVGGCFGRMLPVADVPAGAPVVRFEDATLSPGLIDAHLHLAPWMVYGLIAAGVTTVRDVGNDVAEMIPLLDALPDGPRPTVHWCGPLMESNRVNWPPIAKAHASGAAIRATVDGLADQGLRAIKLYANATAELMAAASDQAHIRGMRVLGHLGATNLDDAVAAGVDELQHLAGCLATDLGEPDWESAARRVAAAPVDHCLTLVVWHALAHLGEPRADRDAAYAWVPRYTREAWSAAHHASQPSSDRLRRVRELLERMAAVQSLRDAGRRLLIGSDSPFPGLTPGFALHDEAGLLVESGFSALEAMRGLTSGNADIIGLTDAGRIVEGAPADLVAFHGDPTKRISDISGVQAVWHAGRRVQMDDLAATAAEVFQRPPTSPMDQLAGQRFIPATG
ncbi:MAG TPA: amidohydrolase family protein [Ilumatobacteraceae bacterium]|nr:amidohydrolase family protein [Ilumatobacteraceae bacterium]